ncbi:MAG: PKD domain-containing protein [Richelia sp. RM2_1_2]|nr:PKD domain-containing protein [Richelia sp. RM2_1_2]
MSIKYSGRLLVSGLLRAIQQAIIPALPDWTTAVEEQKLLAGDAQAGDSFGYSVAISSDGTTAIVGSRDEDTGGSNAGSAYIFTRTGGTWTQQQKIQASDAQAGDFFGYSVAISDDGNTVIVGATGEDTTAIGAGAAYVFTRSGGVWSEQQKIQASDAQSSDAFGVSVALSGDGNTAIVGAEQEDTTANGAGSAYVFIRISGVWTQQQKIQASDAQADDNFSRSVSLSDDGNYALISSPQEDPGGTTTAGSAYVFIRSGGVWTQQAKLIASDKAASDFFGQSVSISNDGATALIGAYLKSGGGAAYIFTRTGVTWTQQQKILATDIAGGDLFGSSVSISGDGNTALVGAYGQDTGASAAGAAYFFTRAGATWTQAKKVIASDAQLDDWFGSAVAISDDNTTAIIGAYSEDTGGAGAGAAYIIIAG